MHLKFAVGSGDEAICLTIVERVAGIIVGKRLARAGCDVADMGIFSAETAVSDGACCIEATILDAVDEIGGVVEVFIISGLPLLCLQTRVAGICKRSDKK